MFSQIYLLCGSHNKVKRLCLKFASLLEASVRQHDFMERVSQLYLFVEESVIFNSHTIFINNKKTAEPLKMNTNFPFHTFPLGEILSLMENLWAMFKFKLKK